MRLNFFSKRIILYLKSGCLIIILFLSTTLVEAKTILIVGSDTLSISNLIEQTNSLSDQLIGIVPNYSFENPYSSLEKIPLPFRNKMKNQKINISRKIDSLLTKVEDVILLSENGCLDFNSAVRILTEKKNLILEQPQKFNLSEAIVLFALSQKYRVDIEIFLNDNLAYLNKYFDANIKEVKRRTEEFKLISKNKTYTLSPDIYTNDGTKRMKSIHQLWDKQEKIHEKDYLNFFTLINVLEKCKTMTETVINLELEYISAFETAYLEMRKFN